MHDTTIAGRRQDPSPEALSAGSSPGPVEPAGRPAGTPEGAGAPSAAWFRALLGPLLLAAGVGVELVLTAVVFVDSAQGNRSELTQWGSSFFLEDRDLPIFAAGTALAVALSVGLIRVWSRRLRSGDGSGSPRMPAWRLQAFLAAAGLALFLNRWDAARQYVREEEPVPAAYLVLFAGIVALSVACAFLARSSKPVADSPAPGQLARASGAKRRRSVFDAVVPLALFAVVYVPEWRQLSGRLFLEESLFHWDYYAMSPALAYHHGQALGREVYSMYGLGWPMLFSALTAWVPLSYGRMIQVGTLYACVYLTGLYLLFRLLVRRPWLAAAATGLALLQLFLFMGDVVLWRFPSLTVMRWAFDVWCLIALVMHHRTGSRLWAAAAGLFVGLAILFGTDTGIYLAVAVACYLLGTQRLSIDARRHLRDGATAVGIAVLVLVAGLLAAGRGDIASPEFWTGWLQALLEFGGGFAQLPMATVPNLVTIAGFAVLFWLYLAALGYAIARLLHRRAGFSEVFNGSVAVYGILNLVHFVGRSGDYTPYRLWIPLAIIAVNLAGAGLEMRRSRPARPPILVAGVTVAAVLAGVAALPSSVLVEPVAEYPGLLSTAIRGSRPDGYCLLVEPTDLCGLPARMAGSANHFRHITGRLLEYKQQGRRFAVVDETGALFYLATDTASFSRYPRIFIAMYTYDKAAEVEEELMSDPPELILTRQRTDPPNFHIKDWPYASFGVAPQSPHAESWERLSAAIRSRYELETDLSPFEIWRLKGSAS